jgi:prepilin-type N-terminal cleavage/methylation domain-containing protein
MAHKSAFTLIELLVVIAIIAVLSVVVILSLNPAELLRQSRDSGRISDMDTINKALGLTQVDGLPLGTANVVYVSIPDPTATSTAGNQCQGLGLPTLPATYTYQCPASSTVQSTNGKGWVPVNFTQMSIGSPLGKLPIDPVNNTTTRLYYTYTTNGSLWELTAVMESLKFKATGSNDGGTLASVYEKGTELGLEPLDYGDTSLVGLWTFDEGSGTVAYDYSGNNATGSWQGTLGSQWTTGKVGSGAGNFNGSNQFVNIGNSSNIEPANSITVSAWVNPSSFTPLSAAVSSITNGYILGYFSAAGSPNIYIWNSGTSNWSAAGSSITLSTNAWQYLVGTFDGRYLRIFINGTQTGVTDLGASGNTIGYNSNTTYIGRYGNNYFPGLIDDVRIYNRALSAAEIQALYNAEK